MIDATEGVTHQDQRLAERIDAAGCPIIVLLNKWELLDEDARKDVLYQMGRKMHFLGDSPVLRGSALTGRGVHRLLPALADAIDQYSTRVPTRKVNELVRRAQQAQPAPHGGQDPLRHPGCDRSADVHAVHQQDASRRATCATSSGRSARSSSCRGRRSSSASVDGATDRL